MDKTKVLIVVAILLWICAVFSVIFAINGVFKNKFTRFVEETMIVENTDCVVNGFVDTFNAYDKLKFIISGDLERDAKKVPYIATIMMACEVDF